MGFEGEEPEAKAAAASVLETDKMMSNFENAKE